VQSNQEVIEFAIIAKFFEIGGGALGPRSTSLHFFPQLKMI